MLESEEDSDDDETPSLDVNHLSGRQMEAQASAKIKNFDGVLYSNFVFVWSSSSSKMAYVMGS